jgi:hypothetical protein
MEIPPAERSEPLWLALAGELEHQQAVEHQRLDTFWLPETSPLGSAL